MARDLLPCRKASGGFSSGRGGATVCNSVSISDSLGAGATQSSGDRGVIPAGADAF